MKEEEMNKKRYRISEQLKQKIKKKPYLEEINGKQYIYSLLKKKNQHFFLSNERFLILLGNQAIAYARTLPSHTYLPFYQQSYLPPFKVLMPLPSVVNVIASGTNLTIEFSDQTKNLRWQFECSSKQIAEEWRQYILGACRFTQISNVNHPIEVDLPPREKAHPNGHSLPLQFPDNPSPSKLHNQSTGNIPNNSPNQKVPQIYQSVKEIIKQPLKTIIQQNDNDSEMIQPPISIQPVKLEGYNLTISRPIDLKEQYHLKREEQQQQKRLLAKQDNKKIKQQIQIVPLPITSLHWDYQFAKGQKQFIIIQQFKNYVENVVINIIDQLSLDKSLQLVIPSEQQPGCKIYIVGDVVFQFFKLQLTEITSFEDRSTVVSNRRIKQARKQFKNADYILQITRNKSRFRVPLMMFVEYKGFSVLAKALVHSTNDYNFITESLQQDITEFQKDTKISRNIFQDDQNLKVLAADQRWFEQQAKSQNRPQKFDICFLTEIHHFLPQDLYGAGREGINYNCLRPQFVEDQYSEQYLFSGGYILGALNKMKVSNETRDAVNMLTDVVKVIPEKIKEMIIQLQNLDEVFTNSRQLEKLFHNNGINIRYLGMALDSTKEIWLRSLLEAQIAARSAKYIFAYDMQEGTLGLSARSTDQSSDYQIGQALGWLNKMLGIGSESEGLWRQVVRQAQNYFKCMIHKENINSGYLLQALQFHGGFFVNNKRKERLFFKTNNIFTKDDFRQFHVKSKTFDPAFTDHYTLLQQKINTFSFENYQQVASLLNFQKKSAIDTHYALNGMDEQLVVFLANWLSPQQAPYLYASSLDQIPSKLLYNIQMTAIKWQMKMGRISQAQLLKNQLIQHIGYWLGQFFPIITDIYDIFSGYYSGFKEEEKLALIYSRCALKNQEKLLGNNHFKMTDSYYNLAEIQLHYCKKGEALISYKRAAQIIQMNSQAETVAYAEVNRRISELLLSCNDIEGAISTAHKSLTLSQQLGNKQEYLCAAEMICRCFQVGQRWQDYGGFAQQLSSKVFIYIESKDELKRLMKIILMPALRGIAYRNHEITYRLVAIIKSFQKRTDQWMDAYIFLKARIQQRIFPNLLLQYLDQIQQIIKDIQLSSSRWKGLDLRSISTNRNNKIQEFMTELQAVNWLVSNGFIQGVLMSEL